MVPRKLKRTTHFEFHVNDGFFCHNTRNLSRDTPQYLSRAKEYLFRETEYLFLDPQYEKLVDRPGKVWTKAARIVSKMTLSEMRDYKNRDKQEVCLLVFFSAFSSQH